MFKKTAQVIHVLIFIAAVVCLLDGIKEDIKQEEVDKVISAAQNNDVDEQLRLGDFFRLGWWHVKKDEKEAVYWYKRASWNGSRTAKKYLCDFYGIGCPNAENSQ